MPELDPEHNPDHDHGHTHCYKHASRKFGIALNQFEEYLSIPNLKAEQIIALNTLIRQQDISRQLFGKYAKQIADVDKDYSTNIINLLNNLSTNPNLLKLFDFAIFKAIPVL